MYDTVLVFNFFSKRNEIRFQNFLKKLFIYNYKLKGSSGPAMKHICTFNFHFSSENMSVLVFSKMSITKGVIIINNILLY